MTTATAKSAPFALSGVQRAAVLILALGEERGGKVLASLDEEDLPVVTRAMAEMGRVPPETVTRAIQDFLGRLARGDTVAGGLSAAARMLGRFLPEDRVAQILDEIRGPAGRTTWDKLSNVSEKSLVDYLSAEQPQTVAVILSKLRPDYAAKVVAALAPALRLAAIERMIALKAVPREVLAQIEETLQGEFMSGFGAGGARRADPPRILAEIFNRTPSDLLDELMAALEPRFGAELDRIRSLMFTFEDLARLDARALEAVIRAADSRLLPVALKAASPGLQEAFLGALSERGAAILRDEIATLANIRLRDAQAAQAEILEVAKRLAEDGAIVIPEAGEDDRVIP
ncbi:flagellar motor switch protein FliG [Inquilinus limosus]|uniref:flagellar motor switch protein FliG n=1 Tax=Inquilinus limosus TaxID=171674 RepID=UPI000403FBC5|nr:flagellar motor switch protein FliG [Inquilinus limosus]